MFDRAEELVLIAVVAVLLFGWRRLPGAVRDLGKARRILKAEVRSLRDDVPLPPKRTIAGETVARGAGSPQGGAARGAADTTTGTGGSDRGW